MSLSSIYDNVICFVADNHKLMLSTLTNYVFIHKNVELEPDFIESIYYLMLIPDNIVIHTNDDNVYVYDITNCTLTLIGIFYIIDMTWEMQNNKLSVIFVCKSSIILFDDKFIKLHAYTFSENECLIEFNTILAEIKYHAKVNEKTHIFDDALKLVTTFPEKYVTIVKWDNYYYCLNNEKNVIDIRNLEWCLITSIECKNMTIKQIYYRDMLIIKNIDNNVYSVRKAISNDVGDIYIMHSFSLNNEIYNIYDVYKYTENCVNKFVNVFHSCHHIRECSCDLLYFFVVFEKELQIYDRRSGHDYIMTSKEIGIEFKNVVKFDSFAQDVVVFIDEHGKTYVRRFSIIIPSIDDIENPELAYDYIKFKPKIKTKKKINRKNARF